MDPQRKGVQGQPGRTWPPTKPAFSLGMLVWVLARWFRSASLIQSRLLNLVSITQGRSLCLGQEGCRRQVSVATGARGSKLRPWPLSPLEFLLLTVLGLRLPSGHRLLITYTHLSQVTCAESHKCIGLPSKSLS